MAPKLDKPPRPSPDEHKTCENCRCWMSSRRREMAHVGNGQWAALADVRKAHFDQKGAILDTSNLALQDMAPCTEAPIWVETAFDHWCHRWLGKLN